jgi:16S rRNA (cytosine967-C5)-methyltransferase
VTASSSPSQVRAAAARLVAAVVQEGRSLDDLLANDAEEGGSRAFKRALTYGTLRWHLRLDAVLGRLADRRPERMPPALRALIEIGLYQLMSGETAPHAAVAETVEAARDLGHGRAAGFVNAVLRRYQREHAAIHALVDVDLAMRTAHPRWLVERLQHQYGDAATAILDANNAHPPMWLRVNRCRWSVAQATTSLTDSGFEVHACGLAPDALRVEPPTDVRRIPGFVDGRISVQDAAAQLAVELLCPRPGQRILDACAAPGGKTCHILERVSGDCRMTAIDISDRRLALVRENLTRLGFSADVRVGDAAEPGAWWDGQRYDRILLDAPCSATGVIRRHPDIKLLRRERDIARLARRQGQLLESAWRMLAPGGILLYTSCSVLREENEDVVARFLVATPGACDQTQILTSAWPSRPYPSAGPGYSVLPGEADLDGFYYACLLNSH